MSLRRRVQQTAPSVGRLLVLLAALAGLFAMHGLSDHGAAGPSEMAMSHASHGAAAKSGQLGDTAFAGDEFRSADDAPEPGNGHDMGAAGMCVAVLIGFLILSLAWWRQRQHQLTAWLPRLVAVTRTSALQREPRPPDLFALFILRC